MKLGNKLKRVKKTSPENFEVTLEFTDGFVGVANLTPIFSQTRRKLIAEILRGNLFSNCFVESGALAWPNGYELCPDALRIWIRDGKKKAAA